MDVMYVDWHYAFLWALTWGWIGTMKMPEAIYTTFEIVGGEL